MAVREDIESLLTESVGMLRTNLHQIKAQMKRRPDTFDVVLNNELARVARCIASLNSEVRKTAAKADDDARDTTQEQRIEIAERWLAALPSDILVPVVDRLRAGLKVIRPVVPAKPRRSRRTDDEA